MGGQAIVLAVIAWLDRVIRADSGGFGGAALGWGQHEARGYEYLLAWFGPEVTEPVRPHVAAKRYLCATEADYFAKLSRDSVLSLSLQGGPLSAQEVAAFDALPGSAEAVRLRRFDEQAKVTNLKTRSIQHFLPYVAACMLPR